ncbi:phosphonate ABC transporter, permease protein PhnE [Pediococcus pentosaceus]|uniref:Phosphonate ABC transporter, permease protein PhnE n=1 Tax=Pediococcus pentosaceus TaxID=1255 RepID=A0A6L5A0H4_PEDPE|nr:phosphonate ABC transporter, permease protein PhnE [Pediococcus pentosaceus]KAF0393192.1 phosphonate ABC transporter, permease protein PhnE [Pediococcus pentosaceus]KAF0412328.1 phosphonate ABC transporter, permease protein PhnE [Pediococcus pentosaceus]KAF0420763.1 phosphonate ABC transporter, permease protein PhnE [Pediococcus pentosaceus]KAF0420779.1 phosphonate ABC transporter, permease protein PhnE [Pediococcus pentosaceus]KAF0433584.1 phosphonate ABC transporter, permease protein PhnE
MTENLKKQNFWARYSWIFWAVLVILFYVWSLTGLQFSGLQESAGEVSKSIVNGLFHPEWSYFYDGSGEDLFSLIIQTLAIAFLGTFVSAILSIPFAFWAARAKRESKFHLRSTSGKFVLVFIRTFPELVLAIMFIKAVGPGSFAGVLAVSIHSIGMLGKLFSEAIENMDRGSEEAIQSAGGSKGDMWILATMPTIMPEFLSYTLYRFEIAVRSASILGMVGAGGIGTPLLFAIQTRNWSRVGIILLGIIVMVTAIDFISGTIRKKLV